MTPTHQHSLSFRILASGSALALLTACMPSGQLDWDLRRGSGMLSTSEAALQATERRPNADARGVISYPGYQVAVARRGDTVASLAQRVGLNPNEVGSYNALMPNDPIREGEIIALPRRVAANTVATAAPVYNNAPVSTAPISGAAVSTGPIDISPITSSAISSGPITTQPIATAPVQSLGTPTPPATTAPKASGEPVRHQVKRGETAFIIARRYNVSAQALAEWNGLNANLDLREGQYLMIPVASQQPPAGVRRAETVTAPGAGSPTPVPPSATKPLPDEKVQPANQKTKGTPASPEMASQRTAASSAKMGMPVSGPIIRPYSKGKNEGIDISAAPGTAVKAAADGTVAAITKDTSQKQIIIVRHANNLLTVYANVDAVSVKKGAKVSRGQTMAKVGGGSPAALHFEVRKGVESMDPQPYLQ